MHHDERRPQFDAETRVLVTTIARVVFDEDVGSHQIELGAVQ